MKKLFASIILMSIFYPAKAQQPDTVKYWTHTGTAGINMSQVSLSNWAAGGDGSLAFDLGFAYSLDYKKDKRIWNNRLELGYGLNRTTTNGTRKTNDKIYLSSTYGYKISKYWYASTFMNFNTQFAQGYNYDVDPDNVISQFMAPGYLTAGVGFTYTPNKWFTATLSPAAWRGTFVLSDNLSEGGAYGVTPGKHMLSEFGANATAEAKYEFLPNMTVYSRLTLFSNYLEKPQNIDMTWDTQVVMKINKWFSANLTFSMIYDDDTKIMKKDGTSSPALQIKEVLGVGLMATF